MDTSFDDGEFTTAGFDMYQWPTVQDSVASEFAMVNQSDPGFSNPCETTICVTFDLTSIPDSLNDPPVHRVAPKPLPVSNCFTSRNTNECVEMNPRFPIYNK